MKDNTQHYPRVGNVSKYRFDRASSPCMSTRNRFNSNKLIIYSTPVTPESCFSYIFWEFIRDKNYNGYTFKYFLQRNRISRFIRTVNCVKPTVYVSTSPVFGWTILTSKWLSTAVFTFHFQHEK